MTKCKICNKSLVPIGNSRKNGKLHADWDTRTMHKKCFVQNNSRTPKGVEELRNYLLKCIVDE